MDIQEWFDKKGSFAEGVDLYKKIPGCNQAFIKSLANENTANFLKLKYELKMALSSGKGAITSVKQNIAPQPKKKPKQESLSKEIIKQSADLSFEKETMAMYPEELHSTYRQRVSDFYMACELKFKLNRIPADDESGALAIIQQLFDLWERIDRAWYILNHWKEHKRIMPVSESEDFSKMTGIQLTMRRNQLQTSISKRSKTLDRLQELAEASPEDRILQNKFNRKKEQLQQLIIDLEKIRSLLQKG